MILEIILGLSLLINMVLFWYIYKLLRNLITFEDGFLELRSKLIDFATHLRGINKVESFYGDPTITALVEHMKTLAKDIEEYSNVIVVFEDDMEELENDKKEEN
jgi:hypothetical protein